jgi:hypothetical protein
VRRAVLVVFGLADMKERKELEDTSLRVDGR